MGWCPDGLNLANYMNNYCNEERLLCFVTLTIAHYWGLGALLMLTVYLEITLCLVG